MWGTPRPVLSEHRYTETLSKRSTWNPRDSRNVHGTASPRYNGRGFRAANFAVIGHDLTGPRRLRFLFLKDLAHEIPNRCLACCSELPVGKTRRSTIVKIVLRSHLSGASEAESLAGIPVIPSRADHPSARPGPFLGPGFFVSLLQCVVSQHHTSSHLLIQMCSCDII